MQFVVGVQNVSLEPLPDRLRQLGYNDDHSSSTISGNPFIDHVSPPPPLPCLTVSLNPSLSTLSK